MTIPDITTITTAEAARDLAIEWQQWVGEQNQLGEAPTLYTSDMADWYAFFEALADKFDLTEEFKENAIL